MTLAFNIYQQWNKETSVQVMFCVIRPNKLHLKAQKMEMNECILMNVWEFEIILSCVAMVLFFH